MDDQNLYITAGDIEKIASDVVRLSGKEHYVQRQLESFSWNRSNCVPMAFFKNPDVWWEMFPTEGIVSSKVLKYVKPNSSYATAIVIHNQILTKQWVGFENYDGEMKIKSFKDKKLHDDYVMVAALGAALNDVNGYVAYRIYPKGSHVLDEIFVKIHLPHSKENFTAFFSDSLYRPPDEARDKPIAERSKTLDEFIESLGVLSNTDIVLVGDREKKHFDPVKTTEEEWEIFKMYQNESDSLQSTAQRFLIAFKKLADELKIPYRK